MSRQDTDAELRLKLLIWYEEYGTWEAVAEDKYNNLVSKALLWKIAKKGHTVKNQRIRRIMGLQIYELAPVCPVHGRACVLNCATEKSVPVAARVSLPGKPRKRSPRTEICAGTPLADIIARVEQVTGHRLAPVEGELEY